MLVAEVTEFLSVSNKPGNLLKISIALLATTLILALWPAYRISRRAIKPLTMLAKDVKYQRQLQQTEQQATIDLSRYRNDDEIEYLATTIEKSINELGESLKRETHFNRDVSHELRTPLTVISNMLALAERRSLDSSDIKQMRLSTEKMVGIVETLLALARLESVELTKVNLRAVLEDCVLSSLQKSEGDFDIHLDVEEKFEVNGNARLLRLLFNNVIENALSHSSSPALDIKLESHTLVFENMADLKLESEASQLLQPNIRHDDSAGMGQGLYLVERIATTLAWTLEIKVVEGNYCLRLYF